MVESLHKKEENLNTLVDSLNEKGRLNLLVC